MKPTIEGIERELINFFEGQNNFIRVADILSKLNLSTASQGIEHKHHNFSVEALLKLYLYKRVKGICTYPDLIESIEPEKQKLGFIELPKKKNIQRICSEKSK